MSAVTCACGRPAIVRMKWVINQPGLPGYGERDGLRVCGRHLTRAVLRAAPHAVARIVYVQLIGRTDRRSP